MTMVIIEVDHVSTMPDEVPGSSFNVLCESVSYNC